VKRRKNEPTHDLQLLEDIEERLDAGLHNLMWDMSLRQLMRTLTFLHDEIERRMNPPTFH
jgi:hypothetical protein